MLNQYGPDLLVQCENASKFSAELVRGWLHAYMFKDRPDGESKARKIAHWLSDHSHFKSHGRHIQRKDLEESGLTVQYLEDDPQAQDLFLSVFHATTHTFSGNAVKIIENHRGRAFIKLAQRIVVQAPHPAGGPAPQSPAGAPAPPKAKRRQARRS